MTSFIHWQNTWKELGVSDPDESLFRQLVACYSEPHRKYHNMQHIEECFLHLRSLHSVISRPAEVELALWFHDAIYNTHRKDNEERSAEWVRESGLKVGLSNDLVSRIYDLVMITKHNTIPKSTDAEILVDIDLGILGAEAERFDEYEIQIQQEYSWVPEHLYRTERRKILKGFLNRQNLYCTEHFRSSFEIQAKKNLTRSLAQLSIRKDISTNPSS
ncbi:MAG: N-methyl-D-aspartate receptor NMDAR2C subunit [Candidatus Riflebacteria bacterium]|nr:N-methyl-D-aspartate receptor NMDAR2C subunit [Candidatus Riflebacteria bacterium]